MTRTEAQPGVRVRCIYSGISHGYRDCGGKTGTITEVAESTGWIVVTGEDGKQLGPGPWSNLANFELLEPDLTFSEFLMESL